MGLAFFCLPSVARAQATLVEVHFANTGIFVKEDAALVKAKVMLFVNGGMSQVVTVQYATHDNPGSGAATAGTDYVPHRPARWCSRPVPRACTSGRSSSPSSMT